MENENSCRKLQKRKLKNKIKFSIGEYSVQQIKIKKKII